MTDFRILVGDPKSGKTFQKVLTPDESRKLFGKKIGETFRGELLGLTGYELQITGGTDKDGFPMRPEVEGSVKKRLLLGSGPGFNPDRKGLRRRKMIRGKIVGSDVAQLNTKVIKQGSIDLGKAFGKEEAPAAAEQKQE
jgi:small subunit ribosomal protein S6e